jgi:hypothetical protein
MCFGRHNNGNFKETHPGGVPIIHDYDDVYSFLVESPEHFKIKDAIALHLFGLNFGKVIRNEEIKKGRPLGNDEITNLIDNRVGAGPGHILSNILDDANERHVEADEVNKEFLKKIIQETKPKVWKIARDGLIGSWAMVASVILLFFIFFMIDKFYISHDLWGEALAFFHLRTPAVTASAAGKIDGLKTAMDDLRQQVTDLKKSPAPVSASPVDAKIDGLKTAIDDLREQITVLKKQAGATPSPPRPHRPSHPSQLHPR